ncbi:hypothetical protein AC481_03340 [miscellaneous Crenarchaeota group archaeon SMTZ-80]|nr:MAG: hypothetical protein AC481_03340 [miscellaneous Crenarchaeota group archaeon SMTZ-80]
MFNPDIFLIKPRQTKRFSSQYICKFEIMKYFRKIGYVIIICTIFTIFSVNMSFGEPIIISNPSLIEVTIDGKWTAINEWEDAVKFELKKSLYDKGTGRFFSGSTFGYFLIKDDKEFLYIMMDYTADKTIQDNDSGRIRIDINNDKASSPQLDDYMIELSWKANSVKKVIWNGNGKEWVLSNKEIAGLKAASTNDASDDPYSISPHLIYEFAIPRDIIGFKSEIGFSANALDYSRTLANSYEGDGRGAVMPRFISLPSLSHYKKPYTWISFSFATNYEKITQTPTTLPRSTEPSPEHITTKTTTTQITSTTKTSDFVSETTNLRMPKTLDGPPTIIIAIAAIVIFLVIILIFVLNKRQ